MVKAAQNVYQVMTGLSEKWREETNTLLQPELIDIILVTCLLWVEWAEIMAESNQEVDWEREREVPLKRDGEEKEKSEMESELVRIDDGHIASQDLIFYLTWAAVWKDGAEKMIEEEERAGDREGGMKMKKEEEGRRENKQEGNEGGS